MVLVYIHTCISDPESDSRFNDQRERSWRAKKKLQSEIQALRKGQVYYIRGWNGVQGRGAKFKRCVTEFPSVEIIDNFVDRRNSSGYLWQEEEGKKSDNP